MYGPQTELKLKWLPEKNNKHYEVMDAVTLTHT